MVSSLKLSMLALPGILLAFGLLALSAQAAVSAAKPFQTALYVREDHGIARQGEPLASGIPFPQGAVFDPGAIRILDAGAKLVPCQAHQLGICWPDGSLRWALVQFQATVAANKTAEYTLKLAATPAPQPSRPVKMTDEGDNVLVSTGPMQFSVSRQDFRLPNVVWVNDSGKFGDQDIVLNNSASVKLVADREHMTPEEFAASGHPAADLASFGMADTGPAKWGKVQPGIDYSAAFSGPMEITVEEAGPMRAVLRIQRPGPRQEGDVDFIARIYAYAGKKYLRVEFSVISCEEFTPVYGVPAAPETYGGTAMAITNSKHVRQYSYAITPTLGSVHSVVLDASAGERDVPADQPLALTQSAQDATALSVGGQITTQQGRCPGWLEVDGARHSAAIAPKYFWETFPKGIAFDPASGALTFNVWPADSQVGYPLPPGRMRTHEFMLGFDTPGPQLSAMARAELLAYPDPEYVTATGACHRFVPLSDSHFSKFADYVHNTDAKDMESRLYGDVDFGDQIGWDVDHRWNGYHGVTHEWFVYYLASGDPHFFRTAEAQTWHSMDVDTFHWGRQTGLREAEYARKFDHVCPAPIQGSIKVWNMGETDYYFLTGKRRVLENLRQNATALLNTGGVVNHVFTPERASSLPFLHLAYMFDAFGSEEAINKLYPGRMKSPNSFKFRTDAMAPDEAVAYLSTLKELSDWFNGVYDRHEHMQSSFLASYPAEAFARYYDLTGDDTAAQGVVKAADFLYNDMIMPTGIIKYAGGPPWDVNSPWMPWWDGVDAPAALAYQVTGNTQYLDDGKAPVDWVLNLHKQAYSSGPWSWQGVMGFGGTLSTYLWAMREAGMTQDNLGDMRKDLDYDKAVQECQAKAMEFYDVSMKNTPESGIFCRLAAEVGRVLVNEGRYDEAEQWLNKWKDAPYGLYPTWVLEYAKAKRAAGK